MAHIADPSRDRDIPVYDADEDINLSDAPMPTPDVHRSDDNRGRRAQPVNGAVVGSGAGAGGGGGPEDYDADTASGGGSPAMGSDRPHPDAGGDALNHGSR